MDQEPEVVGLGEQGLAEFLGQKGEIGGFLLGSVLEERLGVGFFEIGLAGIFYQEAEGGTGFTEDRGEVLGGGGWPEKAKLDLVFPGGAFGEVSGCESEHERGNFPVLLPRCDSDRATAMGSKLTAAGGYF